MHWNLLTIHRKTGLSKKISSLPHPLNTKNKIWFVLGTGDSVNNYKSNYWEKIRNNYSVGINYWALHDFVPNYLMLEFFGNHDSLLDNVLALRSNEFRKCNIVIKGNYLNSNNYKYINSRLNKLPGRLKERMYFSKDFPIPGDNIVDLRKSINLLYSIGFFKKKKKLNYLAQSRGTLVASIIMGIKLGFKEIVLCGVDLSNSGNFYMSDHECYTNKGYPLPSVYEHNLGGSSNKSHWTDREIDNSIKISDSIKVMEEFFRKKLDVKIFVGSNESRLFPGIPLFKWK